MKTYTLELNEEQLIMLDCVLDSASCDNSFDQSDRKLAVEVGDMVTKALEGKS